MPGSPLSRRTFSLLTLAVLLSSPAAAADLVVPEASIVVLDSDGGRPVGGVAVDLLVRAGGDRDFRSLASGVTGRDGRVSFSSFPVAKLQRIGLRFSWEVPNLPRRSLLIEAKAKKTKMQAPAGRLARTGDTHAYYALATSLEGDCENLFEVTGDRGVLDVSLRLPSTYGQCQNTHFKHPDVGRVGQRDINAGARNLYPFEADVALGQDFVNSMRGEQPILDDPLVSNYVVDLIGRIGKASDMPNLKYHVQVIDADVLNAFALPGGYVFVYRGLIEATETESELVGVLAHEVAHVTGRHGTEGMTSAMAKMVVALVIGGWLAEELSDDRDTQELILAAAMTGTNLWVMGGTRKREAEADRLGAQYAIRAGYDPRGLGTFFDKLSQAKGHSGSRLDTLFSDHPSDAARVASVGEMVGYFLPPPERQLVVSSPEYVAVKKRLARLPPPKMAGEAAASRLFSSFQAANEALMWESFLEHVETGEEGAED